MSLSLLSAGLALSAAPARADEPANPPAPPAAPANPPATPAVGGEPAPAPPERHQRHPGYVLADLAEKLGLTADQQKAVGAIIRDSRTQMRGLRADDTLSPEERRAKMREITASTRAAIRAALTPDQQKQFDAMPPPGARPRGPDAN